MGIIITMIVITHISLQVVRMMEIYREPLLLEVNGAREECAFELDTLIPLSFILYKFEC